MPRKEPSGPLAAIIIIVVVLALGGAYYLVREIRTLRDAATQAHTPSQYAYQRH